MCNFALGYRGHNELSIGVCVINYMTQQRQTNFRQLFYFHLLSSDFTIYDYNIYNYYSKFDLFRKVTVTIFNNRISGLESECINNYTR